MEITTFDKLSKEDQSLVKTAMEARENAYTPYSNQFCDNNPNVRIIGATTEGEIELMTIGEIYPYAYGPATKGIDCKKY